jgi:hypothetical protein
MAVRLGKPTIIILLTLVTVGGISTMGIMQSTERMSSSGIIVRPAPPPPSPPSSPPSGPSPPPPEPAVEIDVYTDQGCTQVMTVVDWGEITAGGSSHVSAYVRNNGQTDVVISLQTENWTSQTAYNYMSVSWDYGGSVIGPGGVVEVSLELSVDADCPALTSFGFDIVIIGS